MVVVCVAVCVLWSLAEVHSQTEYPYVSFMGQKLTNNSYVNLNLSNNVLVGCHTDLMSCCNSTDIHQGDWYFSNGERVTLEKGGINIYKRCGDKQVNLLHKNCTWTRDNVTITQGTESVLDDPLNGGYTHTLNVTEAGRQGTHYTCTVANNKPSSDSANITVQAYGI